jgi:hypothetical protein
MPHDPQRYAGFLLHGRCPSWDPSNMLKCDLERFHEGKHLAERPASSVAGGKLYWDRTIYDREPRSTIRTMHRQ